MLPPLGYGASRTITFGIGIFIKSPSVCRREFLVLLDLLLVHHNTILVFSCVPDHWRSLHLVCGPEVLRSKVARLAGCGRPLDADLIWVELACL